MQTRWQAYPNASIRKWGLVIGGLWFEYMLQVMEDDISY